MWSTLIESLREGRVLRFVVNRGPTRASVADVILGWREDPEFRSRFVDWLAGVEFNAFRWETPPVTLTTTYRPFEFVLIDAPGLVTKPDPSAFAAKLGTHCKVAAFANLGGDAQLVVPRPIDPSADYGHLAAFVRTAPADQRHSFWRLVGEQMDARLDDRPVWLSTAGFGVPWLHVRLDDRPKYYGWQPYREAFDPHR